MNTKKIYLMLITIAFLVFVVFASAYIFTLNKIDVNFEATSGEQSEELEESLQQFKGRNLVFLKTEEIATVLSEFTQYKVIEIVKKYPNTINVSVMQRKETFAITSEEKTFILDEEGFVIKSIEDYSSSREIITLNFNGLEVISCKSGQVIETNDNELLFTVMSMAKKVNYYNCISSIEIEKAPEKRYAYLMTYTGVVIEIPDAHVRGEEKIEFAFDQYDKCEDDFIKSFDKIIVFIDANSGELKATWTKNV